MPTGSVSPMLCVDGKQLTERLRLLGEENCEHWTLDSKCIHCGIVLTADEVLDGFSSDWHEKDVRCPECRERFTVMLLMASDDGSSSVRLYSPAESVEALHATYLENPHVPVEQGSPLERSVLIWYGSVTAALAAYHGPRPSWLRRISEAVLRFFSSKREPSVQKIA